VYFEECISGIGRTSDSRLVEHQKFGNSFGTVLMREVDIQKDDIG
jgi:hypothetical protein